MWGSLGDRLAGLGDAITDRASAPAKKAHEQEGPDNVVTSTDGGTVVKLPPTPSQTEGGEDAPDGAAADNQPMPRWASNFAASVSDKQNQQAVLGSFRSWTNTVVESTKNMVNETQRTLEKEQARIQANAPSLFSKGGPYKRDVSLPLDVEALRDAEVVYITDRIVTLSHPYMQSTTDGDITPDRKLASVGHLLQKRHGGRYMIWNLSEVEYDTSVLDDQVLMYKFPGSPSPPLGLLLKLLMAMESWLKADERNVAVMHCLTGRGRTSTVLAAFLCWTGEAGFTDVNSALEYIARCKRISVQSLTIPSQVRYVSYFANMLDGVRPSQPPLMLKRIIMSEAPKFGKRPAQTGESSEGNASGDPLFGCAPYLQIFKAGNLVFTTAASVNYAQTKDDLPFCTTNDGPVSFLTEAVVQGDILLRCRHLTKSGQRVSMFRCAFHTGYVPPKVLRLTKAQLDGACGDKRFADDFFLDLIFEPCDEATASKHLMNDPEKVTTELGEEEGGGGAANEAAERRSMGTVASASNTVSASAYDTMLHRDSRFWDVITKRREENMAKQAELEKKGGQEKDGPESKEDENTPLAGPTIGRRRDFTAKQTPSDSADKKAGGEVSSNAKAKQDRMSAFSIGEGFGLDAPEKSAMNKPLEIPLSPEPKQKDALMEALMDLEDDGLDDEGEVIFESDDGESPSEGVASLEIPSLPLQPTAPAEVEIVDKASESDDIAAVLAPTEEVSPADHEDATSASDITSESKNPDIPTAVDSGTKEESVVDAADILPDISGLGDDAAELDVGAADDDVGDAGDFDDFDDFDDDDADLEDLENFLTKVTSK
mmetsp:Transcript_15781/g.37919  ORF Transcript_15781/g.37919 Transcript_15781/m.37919 type:complete len:826 (-) Transcript_15781:102-2579(-)